MALVFVPARSVLLAPALFGDLVTFQIPCIVHHEFEVVVSVNAHGHIVVVFDPLSLGDASVTLVLNVVGVVLLEGVKELEEDLILGLLAGLDIGVKLSVVFLLDVLQVEDARLVSVHDGERLHGVSFPEFVHLATHTTQELLVVDGATVISIKDLEEAHGVLLIEANTEVVDGFFELFSFERLAVIIISDLELTSESLDTTGSTCGQLGAHNFAKLGLSVVHVLGSGVLVLGGSSRLLFLATSGSSTTLPPCSLVDAGAVKVPC